MNAKTYPLIDSLNYYIALNRTNMSINNTRSKLSIAARENNFSGH